MIFFVFLFHVGGTFHAKVIGRDPAWRTNAKRHLHDIDIQCLAGGDRRGENARGRAQLEAVLREHGIEPAGPAFGNFVFADVGGGRALFEQLLRQGVVVRPLDGFGAPGAIRVSVGTHDENAFFQAALGHVLSGVSS